jgi:photosystem II stability/assembly factor-like uncharacterized protein
MTPELSTPARRTAFTARNLLVLAAAVAAALPAAAPAGVAPLRSTAAHWTPLGPNGGTVVAIVAVPGASRALYAATPSGVDESTDGGGSWRHLDGGLGSRSVLTLDVDPSDARVLYAGTAGSGLYKTLDGGATWRPLPIAAGVLDIQATAIDPHHPATLFAAATMTSLPSRGGLFESTDGGATWSDVGGGSSWSTVVGGLAVDPGDSSAVYAAAFGIYRSADGGRTWSALPGSPAFSGPIVLDPRRPGTILVTSASPLQLSPGSALARSLDGGATWTYVTPPGGQTNEGLPLALAADGTLYTAGFRSADDGTTWAPTAPLDAFASALALDPGSPGTLYAASLDRGVFRSTDGARSWQGASRGLRATGIAAVAVAPTPPGRPDLYVEVPLVGLLRARRNPPVSWLRLEAIDLPTFVTVDPGRPSTLYASTFDDDEGGRILKSEDNGVTWRALALPSGCVIVTTVAVDPRSSSVLYAGGVGATNTCDAEGRFGFKSTDGGDTWTEMPGLHDPLQYAIDPRRTTSLYAIDELSGIRVSRDAGASWSPATAGFVGTPAALAVDPADFDTLYVATDGGLFSSTDGARHWRLISTVVAGAGALLVDPRPPAALYAGIAGRGIFRSTDRGRTWTNLNQDPVTAQFDGVLALDPARAGSLFAGTAASGLYRVTIGGSGR